MYSSSLLGMNESCVPSIVKFKVYGSTVATVTSKDDLSRDFALAFDASEPDAITTVDGKSRRFVSRFPLLLKESR